ncbi:class I SAM-dependent DNA methyltransferase [Brevundimonas sp.]|uniref:class I SAM-dependent DNA methyltransferase n=1 Tax=Brevundimonas sp. TaxID=1871086 RepID=UPI003D6D42FF
MDADDFIRRWSEAPISERAHYQTFIAQLCRLIGVAAPDDERTGDLDYCFERPVKFLHEDGGSHPGYIDCYRRGAFVLEAKQSGKRGAGGALDPQPQLALFGGRGRKASAGVTGGLEALMRNAKRQAENYAKALDEWPPFIVVIDVGRAIELWSDFGRQGKAYVPFPDRARYRIEMAHLRDAAVRDRLRRVWSDPMSLDPAARVAEVTTDIAGRLAWLVRSIGGRVPAGPDGRPDPVARAARANQTALFVMQCIFAMFADSVGLIEDKGFRRFLEGYRGHADQFHLGAGDFFRRMDEGGHCSAIRQTLRRFNGGLFRHAAVLPITEDELEALIAAARRDWASVEPAIFGTLLEQALAPDERAELGAHYTPRAYVERLVEPTIMEPLRADWEAAEASAIGRYVAGDHKSARRLVRDFHRDLCRIRVLDPACGTGNFLYVAMGMMKELEGEVLAVLAEMGEAQGTLALDGHTVSPEQFWGLEKNAYAAWIAEMVMWIGYLQWHFRVYGDAKPSEPILRNFERIRQIDALLSWSREELVRDAIGRPVTRARPRRKDGDAPVLFSVADEREVVRLIDPSPTPWPDVHFIIGNPPFIGGKDLRRELGDGYVDALWHVRQGRFRSADLVTAWWDRAADILTTRGSKLRRFGFITTNSITQTFSRRVLEHHLKGAPPMRLVFAIPDHPWIKGGDRAAVRIAMTVAERGEPDGQGRLLTVMSETGLHTDAPEIVFSEARGAVSADLTVGVDVTEAVALKANALLCSPGVKLHGAGFIVAPDRAAALLSASEPEAASPIRAYRNGRDLADRPRGVNVIDLFGWDEAEVRRRHPAIFQHVLETVKPERDRNNRASYRDNWWIFGEPRRELRPALEGLPRYIATVETAKHRWFQFMEADILPDNRLVCIASDSSAVLGVLSSLLHGDWALAQGGTLEDRPVYTKGACFDAFPFPNLEGRAGAEIAVLAGEVDELRTRVLARHAFLSMTGLYNARARLSAGGPLTEAERAVHEAGCIGLLDHLHRRLDAAVLAAYGWPADLSVQEAMVRLVALNRERAAEEARGEVRFLRPEFQTSRVKTSRRPVQIEAALDAAASLPPLPEAPGAMASALLHALRQEGVPVGPRALAARFGGRHGRRMEDQIEQTLAVLAVAGSVQRTPDGWFTPRRV